MPRRSGMTSGGKDSTDGTVDTFATEPSASDRETPLDRVCTAGGDDGVTMVPLEDEAV